MYILFVDGDMEIWPLYRENHLIKRWQWIDWYIKIELEYKNKYTIRVRIPLKQLLTLE